MAEQDRLAVQFEQNRQHLQAVAYSMLGTVSEAQDAVQEAWLRLDRSDPGGIGDLRGWLTTVVGRISLDLLRARKARRENYPGSWLPEPLVEDSGDGPEHQAVLADSVGLALLVVLDTLSPAERLSFVLHDVFAVPFDDIAQIMDRTRSRPASSPAGHAAGCRRPRSQIVTSPGNARWWTPSSPPPGAAISRRCCRSSTRTWSSGWIWGRPARSHTRRLPGPARSRARSWAPRRGSRTSPSPCS